MTLNIEWSIYKGRVVKESFAVIQKRHGCSEYAVRTAFKKHGIRKTDNRMNRPEVVTYGKVDHENT